MNKDKDKNHASFCRQINACFRPNNAHCAADPGEEPLIGKCPHNRSDEGVGT